MKAFENPAVQDVFDSFDPQQKDGLLLLRALIFDVAEQMKVTVSEELRWGQPAYLTPKGSTLRLGLPKTGGFALYAHCQSSVISSFAAQAPEGYRIEGNRAVLFESEDEVNAAELAPLVRHALAYHVK